MLKFFDADADPGSGIYLTQDPGFGMEMRTRDPPQSPYRNKIFSESDSEQKGCKKIKKD
jgi:hypothetical protein